jgi:GTP 3',8-cyclase
MPNPKMKVTNSMLVDSFGRKHESLRISVTDRCNIRCFYCMPNENIQFLPREQILTFEEISRVVDVAIELGINKIRLTGGEPLVRQGLSDLIRTLANKPGIQDIALTTNGLLLPKLSQDLFSSGLHRLNISLDTLREHVFQTISRREGLQRVLDGIAAAKSAGFSNIRINTVSIPALNEDDIIPLATFCRDHDLLLRFIEFMPLDAEQNWNTASVLTGNKVRERIEEFFGPLQSDESQNVAQPARDYAYSDGRQRVGFINSVTEPFCGSCDRLRLTAEGCLRNCLFGIGEWDLRTILRSNGTDEQLQDLFRECVSKKKAGHGSDDPSFIRPARAMYQIGG